MSWIFVRYLLQFSLSAVVFGYNIVYLLLQQIHSHLYVWYELLDARAYDFLFLRLPVATEHEGTQGLSDVVVFPSTLGPMFS